MYATAFGIRDATDQQQHRPTIYKQPALLNASGTYGPLYRANVLEFVIPHFIPVFPLLGPLGGPHRFMLEMPVTKLRLVGVAGLALVDGSVFIQVA